MIMPCPTESQEGEVLVAYLRAMNLKFTHTANESQSGHKNAMIRGAKMKRQGVSRGFPDYTILVGGSIIFIELKRLRGSSTSPEQKDWIAALNEVANCQAFIAKGANAAITIVEQYLPAKLTPRDTPMF